MPSAHRTSAVLATALVLAFLLSWPRVASGGDNVAGAGDADLRRRVAKALASALRDYPRGSFTVEFESTYSQPTEDELRAARTTIEDSAFAALERAKVPAGEEHDRLRAHAVQGARLLTDSLRSFALPPLKGPLELDFLDAAVQVERSSPWTDGETGKELGAVLISAQFGPSGIVHVMNEPIGGERSGARRITVERLRRTDNDVVEFDGSRYFRLARTIPDEILAELVGTSDRWRAVELGDDRAQFTFDVPTSVDTDPNISHTPAFLCGAFEVTTNRTRGLPLQMTVRDARGGLLEQITWADYVADDHGSLPLKIDHDTWIPGSARELLREHFTARRVRERRRRNLDVLIPLGARVVDRRVEPAIEYTRTGPLPEDAILAAQSAEAAAADLLQHADVRAPEAFGTDQSLNAPSPPERIRSSWRWEGSVAVALVFAVCAGFLHRRIRRQSRLETSPSRVLAGARPSCLVIAGLFAGAAAGEFILARNSHASTGFGVSGDVDLGTVDRGEERTFTMWVRNELDAEVTVEGVSSTCGCTRLKYDRSVISPGEVLRIAASVDTDTPGPRRAVVSAKFRGRNDAVRVGSVAATVRAGWKASQANVVMRFARDAPDSLESQVLLSSDDAVAPTYARCGVDLDFLEAHGQLNGRVLTVQVSPHGTVPLGRYGATITIESDSRASPVHKERVVVDHEGSRVRTDPPTIVTPLDSTSDSAAVSFRVLRDGAALPVRTLVGLDNAVARVGSWRQAPDGRVDVEIVPGVSLHNTAAIRLLLRSEEGDVMVEPIVTAGVADSHHAPIVHK